MFIQLALMEKSFSRLHWEGSTHNQATDYLNSLPDFIQRYQQYIKNIASFKGLD